MRMLNTPITIKNMRLCNRLVMPPMATRVSDDNGAVTDRHRQYYDEKSSGGHIGLIILEHSYIRKEGKAGAGQLSIADDDCVSAMSDLVSVVHKNGTKIIAQINHAGGATTEAISGAVPRSASAVYMQRPALKDSIPEELTITDIQQITDDFACAAKRVQKAGFDGVEIHAAHGYLLNQFFSPLTNKRTDAYTGSTIEGRIKFHLEVIHAVRETVGNDYPIALRLGACDYMEGGSTIADGVYAATAFEQAGVDLLDISGGLCLYDHPSNTSPGYFGDASAAIKQKVNLPVILTGGIRTANDAERLLAAKAADLIGVGRPIVKDSSWAKRALSQC